MLESEDKSFSILSMYVCSGKLSILLFRFFPCGSCFIMNFSKHILYCLIVCCLLYLPFHGILSCLLDRCKNACNITRTLRSRIQKMQNCHLKKICVREHVKTMYGQCCLYLFSFRLKSARWWFHLYLCKGIVLLYMCGFVGVCGACGVYAHMWRSMCLCAHEDQQRT